jgi:fatty acid desaturase
LPDAYFKADFSFLLWIPIHLAVIGTGLWVLTAHFSYWTAPLVSLIIGHSFGCLGFLGHAISHGQSFKRAWVRDTLAGISFSPFGIGPYLWRRWHNAEHHNNTQIEGVDPDHLFTMEGYEQSPVLQALYRMSPLLRNLIIFSSFSYRMTQQTMAMMVTYLRSKKSTFRNKLTIIVQFTLPIAGWVVGTYFLGFKTLVFGYLLPMLVANTLVISYIATNHFLNPLADERDVLGTSLSVTLPKPIQWLDPVHSYFGAHVSHHLFPQAAPKYARKIEAKIQEIYPDRYHVMSLPKALKTLWDTPWVYKGKTELIDPKTLKRSGTLGHGLDAQDK